MKILITGGCGFVGTNLCIYLKKKGHNVFSLDNFLRKGSRYNFHLLKKEGVQNFNIDICDYKKISSLKKFDLIIDCCAEAAVEVSKSDIDRVINTNFFGTINILKKAKLDKSNLIFLSTSRVYSISKIYDLVKNNNEFSKIKKLIDVDFPTSHPISLYGATKLSSEIFIEEFSYAFGLKYIINRCGVISGPLQFGKQDQGFISHWVWSHMQMKSLSYIGFNGSGSQVRDVLHIDDLCSLVYLQIKNLKKKYNLKFNVGGSNFSSINLKNLTLLCNKITGNKIKLKKIKKTSLYDIPYYISDNNLVSKAYMWKPKKNIKDIVNDVYNWLKKEEKKIIKYF